MRTDEFNTRYNPAIDLYPIQGGVEILLVAYAKQKQTLLYYIWISNVMNFNFALPVYLHWHLVVCLASPQPPTRLSSLSCVDYHSHLPLG